MEPDGEGLPQLVRPVERLEGVEVEVQVVDAERRRPLPGGGREGEAQAVASVDGEYEPFPGYYDPAQLDVLREALRDEAGLRRALARLAPPRLEVDATLVASVNTPEALAAALQAAPAAPRPNAPTVPDAT